MKKLTVLIVDDDPQVGRLAQIILERASHQVTLVSTVADAVSMLRRDVFDVVLTDVLLGDEDGVALVREARLMQPSSRIVVMSGGRTLLTPDFCLKLGTSFGATPLKKPFTPKELLFVVEGPFGAHQEVPV